MNTSQYLESVNKRFQSGTAKEHSYRGDLETLIREIVSGVDITNEPANVTDCGNPDYVITKGKIPIGFIEAKDIGKDLNSKLYNEQFSRYQKALDNLIITDYLWFQFFQNGELTHEIRIAEIKGKKIEPLPDNFVEFTNLLQNFCTFVSQTIKSPKKLAEMMAAKARLLENILEKAVTSDEESEENTALKQQYETFKNILIHDLTPHGFADIYAQTLAYGMFAARLHDKTLDSFSRQEAAELIPKSNPFLRKLFNHVAGVDIDERIKRTVDNLAEVFRATNVEDLLRNFGKSTQTHDPIIHFYETFLAEYDPKLRKARGVWYTPEPVVNFIVRSVDEILKTEFDLKDGLADTKKSIIKVKTDKPDRRTKSGYVELDKIIHKVQVLDPATGTGTFLAEVVKTIYNNKFKAIQGAWSGYVEEHLIPRLNGFELLMASYSMAHLKLDMLLGQTGYKPKKEQRFNVFLTNTLEEHHPDTGTLFSSWLSTEANEANSIKRDTPIMIVIGNPPYAVSSSNKGEWIQELLYDYKKDLKERKINLDDDYIKFIRYGQYLIDKNGEGILAYISNNSFIDGITHRQMRKHLLDSFDKIYILNLHGDSNKKETSPDGSKDENVFDIMQGVSINIFIKSRTKSKNKSNLVLHHDIFGRRSEKYEALNAYDLNSIAWNTIKLHKHYNFFVPKDFVLEEKYSRGFKVDSLFNGISGIETKRDYFAMDFEKDKLQKRITDFIENDYASEERKQKFGLRDNEWVVDEAVIELRKTPQWKHSFYPCLHRPFDHRWIIYSNIILARDRGALMGSMNNDNIGLIAARQTKEAFAVLVSNSVCTHKIVTVYDRSFIFPLYLYPSIDDQQTLQSEIARYPNLNMEIVGSISEKLGLTFTEEKTKKKGTLSPIEIFDYIYAALHSTAYREKYKEFLKIDFPRIPYPKNNETFLRLVKLGGELRQIHLLESDVVENYITTYPIDGDNLITRKIVKKDWELYDSENQLGRIWINDKQYFDRIPLKAWQFYIGGYQPAQKWLKDRKGRKLNYDDILHYQKIIVALNETDRIMQELDKIEIE